MRSPSGKTLSLSCSSYNIRQLSLPPPIIESLSQKQRQVFFQKNWKKEGQLKLELYQISNEPGKKENLVHLHRNVVSDLRKVAKQHAATLPPPVNWNRTRWEELMQSVNH